MKNKLLILFGVFGLLIIFVVYLVFPNKSIFLGQWSIITPGKTVKIIGQDVSVTYKKFEDQVYDVTTTLLNDFQRTSIHYRLIFTVHGEEVGTRLVTNNNGYTLRSFPNFFSKNESFQIIQVQKTEKVCDKLTNRYDHLACYTHLSILNNDISYCDKVNLEILPRGIFTCYTSYARYNQNPDLCDLIPDSLSTAEEEIQKCREDIK